MTPQKLSSSPMRSLDYFDLTDNLASLASEVSPGTQGFSSGSDERLQDSLTRSFHSPQKVPNVSRDFSRHPCIAHGVTNASYSLVLFASSAAIETFPQMNQTQVSFFALQSTSGEGLSHCVSVLSSPLNSCELKRAALRELTELLNCSNLWNSEYNFR